MTNTTRTMPMVEEIEAMADHLDNHTSGGEYRRIDGAMSDASDMLRAIADQMRKSKPVAYATHHEPPMVFTEIDEACSYCSEEEQPIPLYTTPLADAEDARRYRFLQERGAAFMNDPEHHLEHGLVMRYCVLDRAIDAAMKEDSHD